jgi:hypothetical protein
MILHDGLLLLGGVVALYLYDSALLLYHNDLVLIVRRNGYGISGGSAFELGGRHVYVPPPLCPHQALFRLNWPQRGVADVEARPLRLRRTTLALAALAPWMWLLLALFAVGLPYALFASGNLLVLLGWIIAVYVTIIATLLQVFRYRKALNLSRRAVLAIAADALLCAPFALNIVRKIGLRQRIDVDLHALAASMLSPAAVRELTGVLGQRIKLSLAFAEPGRADAQALHAYLHAFEELCP